MNKADYFRLNGFDPEVLMDIIYDEYDVDILSDSRDRHTSDVRKMFCAFLYRNTRMTLQNIAEIVHKSIGNVSYYLSTHDLNMGNNVAYADRYNVFQDKMRKESAETI
jgi:hypothetical protein